MTETGAEAYDNYEPLPEPDIFELPRCLHDLVATDVGEALVARELIEKPTVAIGCSIAVCRRTISMPGTTLKINGGCLQGEISNTCIVGV